MPFRFGRLTVKDHEGLARALDVDEDQCWLAPTMLIVANIFPIAVHNLPLLRVGHPTPHGPSCPGMQADPLSRLFRPPLVLAYVYKSILSGLARPDRPGEGPSTDRRWQIRRVRFRCGPPCANARTRLAHIHPRQPVPLCPLPRNTHFQK
jgi:hypothetical protein